MQIGIKILILFLLNQLLISCQSPIPSKPKNDKLNSLMAPAQTEMKEEGNTIFTRFNRPSGFKRVALIQNSFAFYLRNLSLKPVGSRVEYHDGKIKDFSDVYVAVVDLAIGEKNLHQCADAIMRLKAEYHWRAKEYDRIHFNFTNGFRVEYLEWMKGRRMVVDGNKTYWNDRQNPSNEYQDFWAYMELIFMYAGTSSLSKELTKVSIKEMKVGDVFIQGGFPGHAVLVLDMIQNEKTGEKKYLLGQSYMPAQEFQVLANPNDDSPWYSLNDSKEIITPQWDFLNTDLKRFEEH